MKIVNEKSFDSMVKMTEVLEIPQNVRKNILNFHPNLLSPFLQNKYNFLPVVSTAFLLSCPFPLSPEGGGVTVTDIHPGGQAHFHCDPGFQVRGHEVATCVNTTQPHWSTPEPQCVGQ